MESYFGMSRKRRDEIKQQRQAQALSELPLQMLIKSPPNEIQQTFIDREPPTTTIQIETAPGKLINAPAILVQDTVMLEQTKWLLKDLASMGILAIPSRKFYTNLRTQGNRTLANRLVKHLTSHNDKLGVDYVLQPGQAGYYVFSDPEGFTDSRNTYLAYIQEAVEGSPLLRTYPEWFNALSQIKTTSFKGSYIPQPKPVHEKRADADFLAELEDLTDVAQQAAEEVGMPEEVKVIDKESKGQPAEARELAIIQRIRDVIKTLQRTNKQQRVQLDKYSGAVPVYNDQLVRFPKQVESNFKRMLEYAGPNDQRDYAQSIIDAFSKQDVRIPKLTYESVATYRQYGQLQYTMPSGSNTSAVAIGSNCHGLDSPLYLFPSTLVQPDVWTNAVPQSVIAYDGPEEPVDGTQHTVHVVPLGLTNQQLRAGVIRMPWNFQDDIFNKVTVVSSSTRCFKVSSSDNESGTVTVSYHQNGYKTGDDVAILTDYGFDQQTTTRLFAANVGSSECCGGRSGFMYQYSYRPFNQSKLEEKHDPKGRLQRATFTNSNFGNTHVNGTVLFALRNGQIANAPYKMASFNDLANFDDNDDAFLVIESLQQDHTSIAYFQNCAGITFDWECVSNYEGTLQRSTHGFAQRAALLSTDHVSALHLLRKIPQHALFMNKQRALRMIMDDLMTGQVSRGIADWNFVQTFKDIVDWGINQIDQEDTLDMIINSAGELASMALAAVAPELVPAAQLVGAAVRDPLQERGRELMEQVKTWASSGYGSRPLLAITDEKQ